MDKIMHEHLIFAANHNFFWKKKHIDPLRIFVQTLKM